MDDVRVSKLISRVLRHAPSSVGIVLDPAGWVSVDDLLSALTSNGHPVTRDQLERVVATSDKQRFAIDPATDRIRANQGHSVAVDLGLRPAVPPDVLFHGTPIRNLASIESQGLDHRNRLAVHLSADEQTAHRVGARRGAHLVLVVDARGMHRDGHTFTVAANGVWLVKHVPPHYLRRLPDAPAANLIDSATGGWPYLGDPDDEENPWWDLRPGGYAERNAAVAHAEELRAELAPNHPLYGLQFEVIAKYLAADDVLIRLHDGRWALVHLTWNLSRRPEPNGWPETHLLIGRDQVQLAVDDLTAR